MTYAPVTDNAVVTEFSEHPRLGGRCVVELDGERVGAVSFEQASELKLAVGGVVDGARRATILAFVRQTRSITRWIG